VAVAEGDVGATGGGATGDGGWSDCSGRGAFIARVSPVRGRLLRRRRRRPSAGALASVDEAMKRQEMVMSWLPDWCRIEMRA
jgi:hypothetical protein